MPDVVIHPPSRDGGGAIANPLPQLLRTPSGLALVELQGTVSTSGVTNGDDSEIAAALALGRLVFPSYDVGQPDGQGTWDGKRVFLYVGQHQRMTGEAKKLAKPIAILRRRANTETESEELEIAEIVHYKVLFAHRPEPMGGQQQQPQTGS